MRTNIQVSRSADRKSQLIDNGEDCISNLHESIMKHILSRLPTKEAVRTSVLCKDWRYKWTTVYNVELDDLESSLKGSLSLADFMESLLLLCLPHTMKSFSLSCYQEYDLTQMSQWISAVLEPKNIENFEFLYGHEGFVLPQSLLECTSLRTMRLLCRRTFSLRVPAINSFPNLTDVELYGVKILNEDSKTDKLILQFPVLRTFSVYVCKWLNMNFVEIYAPELTAIKWYVGSSAQDDECSIEILGARLAKFEICGGIPHEFILTGSTVDLASVPGSISGELLKLRLRRLLRSLSCVKNLSLTGYIKQSEKIVQAHPELTLPRYDQLERLCISDGGEVKTLMEFLHAAPFLKFLDIHVSGWDLEDYDVVESVPCCIVYFLEEVNLKYDRSFTPKFHFEKFLLKNGKQLKKISVSVLKDIRFSEDALIKQLKRLPRASTCLEVVRGLKT